MSMSSFMEGFPVSTRAATRTLRLDDGLTLVLQALYQEFEDKIMIIITHTGKIAHISSVALENTNIPFVSPEDEFLPMVHLTSQALLGADDSSRSAISQLLAVQAGTLILTSNNQERRDLLVAITPPGSRLFWLHDDHHPEVFRMIVELIAAVLV